MTGALDDRSREELLAELESLRWQLGESRETLRAIGSGEVDAFVVNGAEGPQVFTLKGAEQPYRIMVETMKEGAATLAWDGTIMYGNKALAALLQLPLEKVVGKEFQSFVAPPYLPVVSARLASCATESCQEEIRVLTAAGGQVPVLLSCCPFDLAGSVGITMVLTDLSQQKRNAEVMASEKLALSMVAERTEQLAATVETLKGEILQREKAEDSLLRLNRLYLVLSRDQPRHHLHQGPQPPLRGILPHRRRGRRIQACVGGAFRKGGTTQGRRLAWRHGLFGGGCLR